MIEIKNVRKLYGEKEALSNLSLEIKSGKIFGLIGHNGAGKSTTIKALTSVIKITSGQIIFDGLDLESNRIAIKKKIGYVPDSPDIFLQLTAMEYWDLLCAAYDVPEKLKAERLNRLLNLFNLNNREFETIESFSHGMRQKVVIIGALLSEPDIWILDEPLQGLDPQAAFDLKQMMKEHASKGHTVIFSTHVLDTAQQLCDELAILKNGFLIYNGTVDDLLATKPGATLESIYLELAGRGSAEREHYE